MTSIKQLARGLATLFSKGGRRPAASRARLRVEALEERELLTIATPPIYQIPVPENVPLAMHIHAHLSIVIDGQPQVIPANIGVGPDSDMPMHTDDATGKLHVESPMVQDFHLQDFFTV